MPEIFISGIPGVGVHIKCFRKISQAYFSCYWCRDKHLLGGERKLIIKIFSANY